MRRLRMALAVLALALGVVLQAVPAAAISLDAARAQGLVGESRSGYLAPVRAPSAEVQALIDATNAKRRDYYRSIAGRNGVNPDEVGRLTAEKLINSRPAGAYFEASTGGWRQK